METLLKTFGKDIRLERFSNIHTIFEMSPDFASLAVYLRGLVENRSFQIMPVMISGHKFKRRRV